ncbi:methyltransferase domain-containing protein [Cyanobium sp. ATX 6F1]|uniref:methyltransferase domain-containing protein n=1 Tax=unclassified Cyanobium TaxID=2627006 RepID=UPI0020CC685D|nr:methyltransferase domain-containing protein [Cyanobium sp. ATX 6F1]MCP9917470.1 methyltransferase domain-containing protein [Cyanobium sp. ATX 6F1]
MSEFGNTVIFNRILKFLDISNEFEFDAQVVEVANSGDLGAHFNLSSTFELVKRIQIRNELSISLDILSEPIGSHTGLAYDVVNNEALVDKSLCIFGNSFIDRPHGWGLAPYFCRIFRKVRFCWESAFYPELVEDFKPDIVIFQTCERFLQRAPGKKPYGHYPHIVMNSQSLNRTFFQIKQPTMMIHPTLVPESSDYLIAPTFDCKIYLKSICLGNYGPKNPFCLFSLAQLNKWEMPSSNEIHCVCLESRQFQRIDICHFTQKYIDNGIIELLRSSVSPGKWEIYSFYPRSNQAFELAVGVVIPSSSKDFKLILKCDGRLPVDQFYYHDENLGQAHWFMPENNVVGATYNFENMPMDPYLSFTLQVEDASSGDIIDYMPITIHTNSAMLDCLPDLARIRRVAGPNANACMFLNSGRTSYDRLKYIAKKYGKDIETDKTSILDWGVGCGRVAMHMAQHKNLTLQGIDIDKDNIEWCSNNLLAGIYSFVDPFPPTVLESQSIDLIYSCSVLSHLTQSAADAWMHELKRILRNGGIALLSFNGTSNTASYLSKRPEEFLNVIQDSGFFDGDTCKELDGYIPDSSYYRASFVNDAFWVNLFQKYFNLLGIEYSVVSGHQHIAVLTH